MSPADRFAHLPTLLAADEDLLRRGRWLTVDCRIDLGSEPFFLTIRDGALAALDRACTSKYGGKTLAEMTPEEQDAALKDLEDGELKLEGVDGKSFFEQAVKDIQMGFFADPIYGGNVDMVGWKMIGFPGARYNYLDWINRHNEKFPLPPVSIAGRAEWTPKQT